MFMYVYTYICVNMYVCVRTCECVYLYVYSKLSLDVLGMDLKRQISVLTDLRYLMVQSLVQLRCK